MSIQPPFAHGSGEAADIEIMTSECKQWIEKKGLTRRQLLRMGAFGLVGGVLSPVHMAAAALEDDLAIVAQIPRMARRENPLLVFRDYAADPDGEVEGHIRNQMMQREDLKAILQKKIGSEMPYGLSVEAIEVRLSFVPQDDAQPTAAYHRYCLDITDHLFEMNRMDNIYAAIISPRTSYPAVAETGISAFLVHRLAKAYRAVCRFTAASGRSAKYAVSGAFFSSHLGAVDLEIQSLSPGRYGLARKPFTIWQNDTRDLYTLMSIPVEETLHYHLGKATDREIAASILSDPPASLVAVQRLAKTWMAVEESVVGGLVKRVLDSYCNRRHLTLPGLSDGDGQPVVPPLDQYRYRAQGIQLVQDLGFQKAMALYMDSPSTFKAQLSDAEAA